MTGGVANKLISASATVSAKDSSTSCTVTLPKSSIITGAITYPYVPYTRKIKCRYCDCMNEKDYGKCSYCGAPLSE